MADTLYALQIIFVLNSANCCMSSMAICFENRTAKIKLPASWQGVSFKATVKASWGASLRGVTKIWQRYSRIVCKLQIWDVKYDARSHNAFTRCECRIHGDKGVLAEKKVLLYRAARAGMRTCRSRVILGERLSLGHHARHCKLLSHLAYDQKPVYC